MNILQTYAQSKLEFSIAFNAIILLISALIWFKSGKIYRLSSHKGIKYFSEAFLFFAMSYSISLIYSLILFFKINISLPAEMLVIFLFRYFIILFGFYIVFSLVWKKVYQINPKLIKIKLLSLHVVAAIISLFALTKSLSHVLFLSQILTFSYGALISYHNYQNSKKDSKKRNILQLYFIIMVLALAAWSMHYLAGFLGAYTIEFYTDLITVGIFITFLYGVISLTKKEKRIIISKKK